MSMFTVFSKKQYSELKQRHNAHNRHLMPNEYVHCLFKKTSSFEIWGGFGVGWPHATKNGR
jgi:hypothetical protein